MESVEGGVGCNRDVVGDHEGVRHGFGKLLPILRLSDQLGLARVGQVTSFQQNSRPVLGPQHTHESRPPHAPVSAARRFHQRAVQAERVLQVLAVKGVVLEHEGDSIRGLRRRTVRLPGGFR